MEIYYSTDGKPGRLLSDLRELEHSPYILVIDDEPALVKILMEIMETEGYSSLGISTSANVIPFLQQLTPAQRPRVILTDLTMPEVSGYEIISWVSSQECYSQTRIIVMSASYYVTNVNNVPGADDFLEKPFQITTLFQKITPYYPFLPPTLPVPNELPG